MAVGNIYLAFSYSQVLNCKNFIIPDQPIEDDNFTRTGSSLNDWGDKEILTPIIKEIIERFNNQDTIWGKTPEFEVIIVLWTLQ